MGAVFCFIGWESHRIINYEKQRRGRKALLCVSPSSRAVSRFSKFVYRIIRGKKTKEEVREKPEGIVNRQGGSKVMLPPALIILHKNEESRSGSISFGNLHPSPDSSFLF